MRIVSLNAWGGAMFDALRPWLATLEADVLCLQEVTRTAGLAGWTDFDDGEHALPQRANLFEDVRDVLPTHQAFFVVSDRGPVIDAAGGRHPQDFGLATFVAGHLPVVGLQTAFVHGAFVHHDEWPTGGRPRVALATRVVDGPGIHGRSQGRGVTVVQVHGLRDPAGKADTPDRLAQARRLADLVRRAANPGDLVVVCGDLNLLPGSETFAVLADAGLVDLVGEADTRSSRYAKPVRHASYLLVRDPEAVARFEVVAEPEVSDHRALVVEL